MMLNDSSQHPPASRPQPRPTPAPGESWKGVRELERAYGLAHGQIRKWIKKGLIDPTAIQEPTRPGDQRLIDEATINTLTVEVHRPRGPKYSRAVLISGTNTDEPSHIIPPQLVTPSAPISASIPTELPAGLVSTAQLVSDYLALRELAVQRKAIAPTTYRVEHQFMRKWALHTPIFPWSQLDIDSYEASLGAKPSRMHALRYVRRLSIWAMERYPDAKLPVKFPIGTNKPPRHDVMTQDQERTILAQLRTTYPQLWVYATILNRTGCRSFELTDADWEDLTSQGFVTKGRAKKTAGAVYFPPGLYDFISANMPPPHTGPLFLNYHGNRYGDSPLIATALRNALCRIDLAGYNGPLGPYMFRHLYAERIKDHMPIERAATIMRTSVKMLERTYGKHTEESYHAIIDNFDQTIFGDNPLPA